MKHQTKKPVTLKNLTKGNVWELSENDVFKLWRSAEKDAEAKESMPRYEAVLSTAFLIETVDAGNARAQAGLEARGYKVATVSGLDGGKAKRAVKKRPIVSVADLTCDNIRHISAAKLLEVVDGNFGGGWDSLPQQVQAVISSGFDIVTTSLPKERLKKKGGLYDKLVSDGYDVLEIARGSWVEAIFAREKEDEPAVVEAPAPVDTAEKAADGVEGGRREADDDDDIDDGEMAEESYRTEFDSSEDGMPLDMVGDEDYEG